MVLSDGIPPIPMDVKYVFSLKLQFLGITPFLEKHTKTMVCRYIAWDSWSSISSWESTHGTNVDHVAYDMSLKIGYP